MDDPWRVTYAAAPAEVRPWLLDLRWEAVRALERPIELIPVRELEWILDLPLWWRDGRAFRLSPREVLAAPARFPGQYERMLDADLTVPVDVASHLGRLVVVDGVHRLLKAVALGHTAIAMREVPLDAVRALAA